MSNCAMRQRAGTSPAWRTASKKRKNVQTILKNAFCCPAPKRIIIKLEAYTTLVKVGER